MLKLLVTVIKSMIFGFLMMIPVIGQVPDYPVLPPKVLSNVKMLDHSIAMMLERHNNQFIVAWINYQKLLDDWAWRKRKAAGVVHASDQSIDIDIIKLENKLKTSIGIVLKEWSLIEQYLKQINKSTKKLKEN